MRGNLPDEVVIELLTSCNLQCDFCYNSKRQKAVLAKEIIFEILKQAKECGIEAVRFTGGELFLYPDILDVLEKAKELKLFVILNTNGSLINESNRQLLDYADLVLVSMHHLEDIDYVKRVPEEKRMIATIASKENIVNLEKFYEVISKLKFKDWFLLRQIGQDFDIDLLVSKLTKLNEQYGLKVKIANAVPFCAAKGIDKVCKGGVVDSGYSRIFIDAEGNYRLDYFSKSIKPFREQRIIDYWNSLDVIRKKNPTYCEKCYQQEVY